MPVEIRELHIKGSVSTGNRQIEKKFEQANSQLHDTRFIRQLKKDIINECLEKMTSKLNRINAR